MVNRSDMTTFADLGIDFPLFEAPVRSCGTRVEAKTCDLCNMDHHYFHRTSETYWIGACPECGTTNKWTTREGFADGSDWVWRCVGCEEKLPRRSLMQTESESFVCFCCIRDRHIEFPKDTEFGLVDADTVASGVTGGIPDLTKAEGFELVVVDENWNGARRRRDRVVSRGVRIAPEDLRELLLTPTYFGWQDERWLFCCRRPMIFIGHWFDVVRVLGPADRGELFRRIFETVDTEQAGPYDDYLAASRKFDRSDPEMYVFRCRECERLRAYVDCS